MTEATTGAADSFWRRLSGPLKVGLFFTALGILLAIVGIFRGMVPLNPLSIFLALLISGGSWGVVSWAIAAAAADVDRDVAEAEIDGNGGNEENEGNEGD